MYRKSDIHMEFRQELYLGPRFDYLEFFNNQFLTDCELRVRSLESDGFDTIRAHRVILANSSDFFYNSFTSGMTEAETGIVEMTKNPMGLLPRVIQYLYSGNIEFDESEAMSLLFIAHDYGINSLTARLQAYIDSVESPDVILRFADQCFESEFVSELKDLVPAIARMYDKFAMSRLTTALDVPTFALVLASLKNLDDSKKVNELLEFIGKGYTCVDEDREAIGHLFAKSSSNIRQRLIASGLDLQPKHFQ